MPKYKVKSPIHHQGKVFFPGEIVELSIEKGQYHGQALEVIRDTDKLKKTIDNQTDA